MKCLLSTFIVSFIGFCSFAEIFSGCQRHLEEDSAQVFNGRFVPVDNVRYTNLKAVLVVGHIESLTASTILSMNDIARFLTNKGVEVHKFYDNKAIWEDIVKEANGANIFVYAGHGSNLGENGGSGGICVAKTISANTMMADLKLHDNALIVFKSVCNGAGSSASDDEDIGIKEAVQRVTDYSNPFFKIGASAYYANNYGGGCLEFLKLFFEGKTIKECHEIASENYHIEVAKAYLHDSSKQISITSHKSNSITTRTTTINGVEKVEKFPSIKEYDIAYVADPEFSISHLVK